MNNTDLVKENIEIDVESKSLNIYLRVTESCENVEDTSFSMSIDETGNLILTPNDNSCEFVSVSILTKEEFELSNSEGPETASDTKEYTIHILATILSENNDLTIEPFIDNIGQIVLCFKSDNNQFISATLPDSLNLITEDSDENRLQSTETDTDEQKPAEMPKVSAEVIDENYDNNINTELNSELIDATNNFEDTDGTIGCDTQDELVYCFKELLKHYNNIIVELTPEKLQIIYHNDISEV